MSIHRVIYRDKPKEAIFRSISKTFFNNNPDCEIATISITKGEPKRSDAQNRIYHTWVDILRKEFGESKQDCKENLAFEFLGDKDKSTKDLTVPEFDQFLKDIDRYFSVEWSMKLPRDEDFPKTMIKDEHKT
jgi:hypothetical protein